MADHDMLVLLYGLELEILQEVGGEDRGPLMREAAGAYRARAKLQAAAGRVEAAKTDLARAETWDAESRKSAAIPKGKAEELRELAKQVEQLRKELDRTLAEMRRAPPVRRQTSSPPATGRIELVNAWTGPVTILIDGGTYDLQPRQTLGLTRAAGDFRYEVRGIQVPVTRSLGAGETFTIRVGPR